MRRRAPVFVAIVACAVALAAALVRPPRRERRGRLALATIFPVADIARNVAGGRFEVASILPPGASPHTFEPTPEELRAVADAAILLQVGLGLELWAGRLIGSAARPGLEVITVSDGIVLLRNESNEPGAAGAHAHAHPAEAGEFNPHVWLDPVNALVMVDAMAQAFAEADPEGARVYAENAARYAGELARLDSEHRRALAGTGPRRVVAFHNSFAYLARRYGIEVVGLVEESPGREPDARHVRDLIDRVRGLGVRAVLVEPQLSPKVAEAIARDSGARVVRVDPLGDPSDPARATYVALMRSNLRALVEGLAAPGADVEGGGE